jgi:tetratricopeptide (TPR) repeat protein
VAKRETLGNTTRTITVAVALVVVTLAIYWRVGGYDFLNYDDDVYVVANPQVQMGFSKAGIAWAFTTTHASNYWHPLTWVSHMLDVEIFGIDPGKHHLVNVIFHLINSILLFLVLLRMTGALWPSGFVAALFAVHPLHVESVAWVAERKDVLSTFFWVLALWAYTWYIDRKTVGRYVAVFLLFAMGLMSKPMVVTLPFLLLLLDYWPLERWHPGTGDTHSSLKAGRMSSFLHLFLEKIPLLVLSGAGGVMTYFAQDRAGGIAFFSDLPILVRIANAVVAYAGYIGRLFCPVSLAVLYPHSGGAPPVWTTVGAGFFLIATTGLVIWNAKKRRYLPVGWFWFLGTLVPVIGVVQAGEQSMADRYSYVPLIGLFMIIAFGASDLTKGWRYRTPALALSSGGAIVAFAAISWLQVGYWKDSATLFQHAIEVTSNNWVAYHNLGVEQARQGKDDDAIASLRESLRINPLYEKAHYNLGTILAKHGRLGDAIQHLGEAVRIQPDYAKAHYNLGVALLQSGKPEEALIHLKESHRLDSKSGEYRP